MPDIVGVGTEFRRYDGVSAWTKIASIMKIGGPDSKRDTIDTTDLDTTGGYRTFIGGLRDGGGIKLTMKFGRDTFEIMRDDFESDDLQDYEIVLPDDEHTSFHFQGLVTEIPLTIDEKLVMADVTIKISGPITINSGSGPVPS